MNDEENCPFSYTGLETELMQKSVQIPCIFTLMWLFFFFLLFPEGAGLIIKNIYIAQTLINILSAGKEGIVLARLPFPSFTHPHFQIRDWNKEKGLFLRKDFLLFFFLILLLPCPFSSL